MRKFQRLGKRFLNLIFIFMKQVCLLLVTIAALPSTGHPVNAELDVMKTTPVPEQVVNHTESAVDVRAVIDPPVIIERKANEQKTSAIRTSNRSQFFSTLPIIRWDFGR